MAAGPSDTAIVINKATSGSYTYQIDSRVPSAPLSNAPVMIAFHDTSGYGSDNTAQWNYFNNLIKNWIGLGGVVIAPQLDSPAGEIWDIQSTAEGDNSSVMIWDYLMDTWIPANFTYTSSEKIYVTGFSAGESACNSVFSHRDDEVAAGYFVAQASRDFADNIKRPCVGACDPEDTAGNRYADMKQKFTGITQAGATAALDYGETDARDGVMLFNPYAEWIEETADGAAHTEFERYYTPTNTTSESKRNIYDWLLQWTVTDSRFPLASTWHPAIETQCAFLWIANSFTVGESAAPSIMDITGTQGILDQPGTAGQPAVVEIAPWAINFNNDGLDTGVSTGLYNDTETWLETIMAGSCSFGAMIRFNENDRSSGSIIGAGGVTTGTSRYIGRDGVNNQMRLFIKRDATDLEATDDDGVLADDTWYTYRFDWDGTNAPEVYRDGAAPAASTLTAGSGTVTAIAPAGPFVGNRQKSGGARNFPGAISIITVFDTDLTAGQVTNMDAWLALQKTAVEETDRWLSFGHSAVSGTIDHYLNGLPRNADGAIVTVSGS